MVQGGFPEFVFCHDVLAPVQALDGGLLHGIEIPLSNMSLTLVGQINTGSDATWYTAVILAPSSRSLLFAALTACYASFVLNHELDEILRLTSP